MEIQNPFVLNDEKTDDDVQYFNYQIKLGTNKSFQFNLPMSQRTVNNITISIDNAVAGLQGMDERYIACDCAKGPYIPRQDYTLQQFPIVCSLRPISDLQAQYCNFRGKSDYQVKLNAQAGQRVKIYLGQLNMDFSFFEVSELTVALSLNFTIGYYYK